jgi:hypothetical protein
VERKETGKGHQMSEYFPRYSHIRWLIRLGIRYSQSKMAPDRRPPILALFSRIVSKHWLSVANHKRTPHCPSAIDCGAPNRDVRGVPACNTNDCSVAFDHAVGCWPSYPMEKLND